MSAFRKITTEMRVTAWMVSALTKVSNGKYTPQVHEQPVNLYGYQNDKRPQVAHVVVPRQQISRLANDIGFEHTPSGYVAHISEFDRGVHNDSWMGKVKTLYGVEAAKHAAAQNGYTVSSLTTTPTKHGTRTRMTVETNA